MLHDKTTMATEPQKLHIIQYSLHARETAGYQPGDAKLVQLVRDNAMQYFSAQLVFLLTTRCIKELINLYNKQITNGDRVSSEIFCTNFAVVLHSQNFAHNKSFYAICCECNA